MRIEGIIWLEMIVEKLAVKHRIEQYEIEEIFSNRPKFRFVEKGRRKNEDMYMALGKTDTGRYLTVFFICKITNKAIVVSARDMAPKERRYYDRK